MVKLILTQKTATLDGSNVAYVEATIHIDKYSYRVLFDKQTKKRFNAYCKSLGFKVGKVKDSEVSEKFEEMSADLELPL